MSALPQATPTIETGDTGLPVDEQPGEIADILPFVFPTKAQYKAYRERLWSRDPHCTYCRQRIGKGNGTLDHILPKSKGGFDAPYNLVLSCERCNQCKESRTVEEWRDHLIAAIEQMVPTRG